MIKISDKHTCCGCGACVQGCPKHCITLRPDDEGFWYPHINEDVCVNCNLCEKVCPILSIRCEVSKIDAYSGIINDESIRCTSSSGGLFWALSSYVIDKGGIVFGASFDENWNVVHTEAKTLNQLTAFKGSKYVQSSLDGIFSRVKDYLKSQKSVLFSGTPCQIAGLRSYLRVEYPQLYLVEIACHGVPSPALWQSYLQFLKKDLADEIKSVDFRDKKNGWKSYQLTIDILRYSRLTKRKRKVISERPINNLYLGLFRKNISLRPSCYQCNFKSGKSGTDITLCDFWGISSSSRFNDEKGASAIIVYSKKGDRLLSEIKNTVSLDVADYDYIVRNNHCLVGSVQEPAIRKEFWRHFQTKGIIGVRKYAKPSINEIYKVLLSTIKNKIKAIIR